MLATGKNEYIDDVINGLWDFALDRYADQADLFECFDRSDRPPVFACQAAARNVLTPPEASELTRKAIIDSLPVTKRHRYFASMRSSQALAQSMFGSLAALDKLELLADVFAEDGTPAFGENVGGSKMVLEYSATQFSEPQPTSIDVWFAGEQRIAVECKFTEGEFGCCSRPLLKPELGGNNARNHCDGSYSQQRERKSKCSLTEIGVKYWDFIPDVLTWPPDQDQSPCPLRATYQLVRNVLTACVKNDDHPGSISGHALIIYDARNPAFVDGGIADVQWQAGVNALRDKRLLRRCSWQRLIAQIDHDPDLAWLINDLAEKYGLSRE